MPRVLISRRGENVFEVWFNFIFIFTQPLLGSFPLSVTILVREKPSTSPKYTGVARVKKASLNVKSRERIL